jgi:hypothetical protein
MKKNYDENYISKKNHRRKSTLTHKGKFDEDELEIKSVKYFVEKQRKLSNGYFFQCFLSRANRVLFLLLRLLPLEW